MNIWTLGVDKSNATKNISWVSSWPNFADVDILIINLTSLNENLLKNQDFEKFDEASATIMDRMLKGASIIVITAPSFITLLKSSKKYMSNYLITPMTLNTQDVTDGTNILYTDDNLFRTYLTHVKKFNFIITSADSKRIRNTSKIGIAPTMIYKTEFHVTNKAGHDIGIGYTVGEGALIYLPPFTGISSQEGINKIIECLQGTKSEKKESPPEWIKNVKLSNFDKIKEKIKELETEKTKLELQILKENVEKNKLENFYDLLFAQNTQLEECVKTAFEILGFNEIRRIRNKNDEDWIIDFTTLDEVEHGVIEVKGRNEKTTQADIVQCNKWVDDYQLMIPPKNTKGVFISNQFRLKSYPESKDDRIKYEPNELAYAKGREICIIPSFVLFEAVNSILSGKQKTRKQIEKLIYETNGVLLKL